jgi:hypothetical protein
MSKLYVDIAAFRFSENDNENEDRNRKERERDIDNDTIDINIMGDFNNKVIIDYLIDNEYDVQVQLLTLELKDKWCHLELLTDINYIDIMKILEQTMCVNEYEYNEDNVDNIEFDENTYTYTYLDESEKNILL